MLMKKILLLSTLVMGATLAMADNKTINVTTAGSLSTLISESEKETVTELTLTGNINKSDFLFIDTQMKNLESLNIKDVNIQAVTLNEKKYPANEIPDSAFMQNGYENQNNVWVYTGNKNIKSFILPSSITSIGNSAFDEVKATSIDFSNCTALEIIKSHAFDGVQVTSINLSGLTSLKTIGDYAFCQTQATTINLEGCSALEALGERAFAQSYFVTSVNLNGCTSFKTVSDRSFLNLAKNSAPKSFIIDLSDTQIETIVTSAFQSSKATEYVFPTTLKEIEAKAFYLANAIKKLTFNSASVTIAENSFQSTVMDNATIIVPEGAENTYKDYGFEKATATTTGINSLIINNKKNGNIYTIDGKKVSNANHGLFIVNGKKVLVK